LVSDINHYTNFFSHNFKELNNIYAVDATDAALKKLFIFSLYPWGDISLTEPRNIGENSDYV